MLCILLALLLFLFAAWGIFLLSSLGDFLLDIYSHIKPTRQKILEMIL